MIICTMLAGFGKFFLLVAIFNFCVWMAISSFTFSKEYKKIFLYLLKSGTSGNTNNSYIFLSNSICTYARASPTDKENFNLTIHWHVTLIALPLPPFPRFSTDPESDRVSVKRTVSLDLTVCRGLRQ